MLMPRPNAPGTEPEGGVSRVIFKLRKEGPWWIIRRLSSEWTLPTTGPGQVIHFVLRKLMANVSAPYRLFRRAVRQGSEDNRQILYAFYDLKVQPITYDVVWFLSGADLARRKLGLKGVHIVIVPGPDHGVRNEGSDYEVVVDWEARRWRIFNILIASVSLLPSAVGITVAASRSEAAAIHAEAGNRIYPQAYEPLLAVGHHPNDSLQPSREGVRPIGVLRATTQGLRYIDRWIANYGKGRRLLTITLRNYEFGKARNSDIESWASFVTRLDLISWWPVFVLDTERTMDPLPEGLKGFDVLKEASWNIGIRMALYERAWLNLGVNNGPMGLCWLNDRTRYLTFKMVTPSVPQSTVAFNRSRGFEPNENLPFATPYQKWIWQDDTVEVIEHEFDAMVPLIERHQANVSSY